MGEYQCPLCGHITSGFEQQEFEPHVKQHDAKDAELDRLRSALSEAEGQAETLRIYLHGMQDGAILQDQLVLLSRLESENAQLRSRLSAVNAAIEAAREVICPKVAGKFAPAFDTRVKLMGAAIAAFDAKDEPEPREFISRHSMAAHAQGCVCPPGANLTCNNPLCPRGGKGMTVSNSGASK